VIISSHQTSERSDIRLRLTPIETALASLECRELDACIARKVPASLSLVHRLFRKSKFVQSLSLKTIDQSSSAFPLDIEETFHKLIAESV